jgi:rSAM/selenodomain-associated transferase 2
MKISIIIPTLNEAGTIFGLLSSLLTRGNPSLQEIIVVDGGSTDDTVAIAAANPVRVVTSPLKGRAAQMNYGASLASGDVFYFVHADSLPPGSYATDLHRFVTEGYEVGRYRTRFDHPGWLLKFNAFFTRFDWFVCYGGDQTLYITRGLFDKIGGYDNKLHLMEEYDLVTRARKIAKYKIMPAAALVSARKYKDNSWWKVQQANFEIVQMYKRGALQEMMVKRYNELLQYR